MTSLKVCAFVLAAGLPAACSSPAPSSRQSAPAETFAPATWTLSPTAFGPVRIGGTLADMNTALGEDLVAASDDCGYVRPATFPPGVSVMVVNGVVVRIDVEAPGVQTPEGLGVDDTEADVVARYGSRAVVSPHKYTGPQGHYVTVPDPDDATRRTVFETDGTRVERFRAGLTPAVEFVEGCG